MQIHALNSINLKNLSSSKIFQNQQSQTQISSNNYAIGALDALAFKGAGMYTDLQICDKMLEDAPIKCIGDRFSKEEVAMLKKEIRNFKTVKGLKKSAVLGNLLHMRTQENHGEELNAQDFKNYFRTMFGATPAEHAAMQGIVEADVRSGISDAQERDELIFKKVRYGKISLKTLVKLNEQLTKKNMSTPLKNDILWWVFSFMDPKKPYMEKNYKIIAKKLEESNLELAPIIDNMDMFLKEREFTRILPFLTVENKDEVRYNDAMASSLSWKREKAVNEFIQKYS